ncbi:GGDEF domain-containing protein [Actinoplanes sp. NPDC051861]|uniref:GGDEF domain-containing protein n=1 Tax=Actinoplanes sp. NPDC051861 TaxID=3155170 RepID=UPI0034406E14
MPTSRFARAHLFVAVLALAGFVAVPDGSDLQLVWQVAVGWYAAAVIVAAVRHHGAPMRLFWWLIALGVAGNASGILVEYVLMRVEGEPGFPSWADLAYLSLYPTVAAGLLMLIRRRTAERDWSSIVDATTLTTGMGLLAWIFMIKPAASDPSIGLLGHVASVAYPVGDVVLLAMTIRMLLAGGGRNVSFRLICAALVTFLAGDTAWAVINQAGWEPGPLAHSLLADVFLSGYLLFAAAAVHPDVRSLPRAVAPRPARPSRTLLVLLTAASLIGPGLLIVQASRHEVADTLSIGVGCAVLFLLVVTRMSQLVTQLDVQTQRVRELAVTDELTGLPNRRAWNIELPRTMENARRTGSPVAVALIDIDHFKRFNDAYGHPAGDLLLKEAAAAWADNVRAVDHLARYGGEEFILLMPGTTAAQAHEIVDRMLQATPLGQTFSAGVATWNGDEATDSLIARADAALYEAKNTGRNRISHATPHPLPA